MFGIRKIKALNSATAFVKPLVGGVERLHGPVPKEVWEDPYVLGYLERLMVYCAKSETNGKIKTEELGWVLMHCFEDLFGAVIGKELINLCIACQNGNDPEFIRGMESADKYLAELNGSDVYKDDPDVIKAQELSVVMLRTMGQGSVAGALAQKLFLEYIRVKYFRQSK